MHSLVAASKSLGVSTDRLRQDRRLPGFTPDNHGEQFLDDLLRSFEEEFSKWNSDIQSLLQQRPAARDNIATGKESAERKRLAEGGPGPLWEGEMEFGSRCV